MDEKKPETVFKFTLSTGKVVLLREMRIEFQEMAAKACSSKAGDSPLLLGVMMQKELVKLLIAQVNGKTLTGVEKENLNALFEFKEYQQVLQAVKMVMGDDEDAGKPQLEIVSSGNT